MNELLSSLFFYKESLLALFLSAPLLVYTGIQLYQREKLIQVFGVSHGLIFFYLLLLFFYELILGRAPGHVESYLFAPFFLMISWFFILLIQRLINESLGVISFFLGVLFSAFSMILLRLFPYLDHHYQRIFGGDFVTVMPSEAIFLTLLFLLLITWAVLKHRDWSLEGIDFHFFSLQSKIKRPQLSFDFFSLILFSASLLFLGPLYTLGLVGLLPLLTRKAVMSFRSYLRLNLSLGLIGTMLGAFLSLIIDQLSATAGIIALLGILGLLIAVIKK